MSQRFQGKTAVITGGNGGIGLETALLFRAEGANVAIFGRNAATVSSSVVALGGDKHALGHVGDVGNAKDVAAFYAAVKAKFTSVDIVFANAGIAERAMIAEVTEDSIDRMFNTNVKGVLFTVQHALPLLRDGGSIIVNTSIVDQKGFPNSSVYSATKGAVRSFVRTFAAELTPRRIRVNAVAPGPIVGDAQTKLAGSDEAAKATTAFYSTQVPLKRMGTAREVANAVLFFASEDSTYTTGAELMVDGGWSQL